MHRERRHRRRGRRRSRRPARHVLDEGLDAFADRDDEVDGEFYRVEDREQVQRPRYARVGRAVIAEVDQHLQDRLNQVDERLHDRRCPCRRGEIGDRLQKRQRPLPWDQDELRILISPAIGAGALRAVPQETADCVGQCRIGVSVRQRAGGVVAVRDQIVAVDVFERGQRVKDGQRVPPIQGCVADGVVLEDIVGALDPDVRRQLRPECDIENWDC